MLCNCPSLVQIATVYIHTNYFVMYDGSNHIQSDTRKTNEFWTAATLLLFVVEDFLVMLLKIDFFRILETMVQWITIKGTNGINVNQKQQAFRFTKRKTRVADNFLKRLDNMCIWLRRHHMSNVVYKKYVIFFLVKFEVFFFISVLKNRFAFKFP